MFDRFFPNSKIDGSSVFGRIHNLVNSEFIRIGLPKYEVEPGSESNAVVRVAMGETVKNAGSAMGASCRIVSTHKDSIILTLLGDSSSRDLELDKYSVRSRTVASIQNGLKIKSIMIQDGVGKSYQPMDLSRISFIFPELHKDDYQTFIELKYRIAQLQHKREFVKKDRDNLKNVMKKRDLTEQVYDGIRAFWKDAEGQGERPHEFVDGAWVPVKQEAYTTTNNVCLVIPTEFPEPDRIKGKPENLIHLPRLMKSYDELGEQIEQLLCIVRPFELGLIERGIDKLNEVQFEVKWYDQQGCAYPADTEAKLLNGTYKLMPYDLKNGGWCWEPVKVETEAATV